MVIEAKESSSGTLKVLAKAGVRRAKANRTARESFFMVSFSTRSRIVCKLGGEYRISDTGNRIERKSEIVLLRSRKATADYADDTASANAQCLTSNSSTSIRYPKSGIRNCLYGGGTGSRVPTGTQGMQRNNRAVVSQRPFGKPWASIASSE